MKDLEKKTEEKFEEDYSGGGPVYEPKEGYRSKEGIFGKIILYVREKKEYYWARFGWN